jgi:membrane protein
VGDDHLLIGARPQEIPQLVATGAGPAGSAKVELRRITGLHWSQVWFLLTATWDRFLLHRVPRLGAALAFYTMLSLAPLLVVVIALAGWAFGREAAIGQVLWQIQDLVGYEGAQTVKALLTAAHKPTSGTIAAILGLITLFFGASSVVAELRDALNTIWDVPPKEICGPLKSIVSLLKDRTLAFAMVLGVGFLLLVSLAVNAALAALGGYFTDYLPAQEWILQSVNFLISFAVITLMFAMIYKILPDIYIAWSDVALGAAITSLLFTIGKMLIGLYLGKASFMSTYGAAGSLVVLLFWVYYSAQIFFLGAEFTHVYAEAYGSHPSQTAQKKVEVAGSAIPENKIMLEPGK